MADPITELANLFSGITRGIQESGIIELLGVVIAIIIVAVIGGLVLLAVVKMLKKGREYVGSSGHLGTYRINIRHKSHFTGNINTSKSFLTNDILERMKNVPQIKADPIKSQGVVDMQDLWKQDLLYAYDMKVFDSLDDMPDNDIVLLSSVKLEENTVSWDDEKGEWSFTGSSTSMFRRYPKNIQCSELTEFYDIPDVHGKKKRVYILVVFSDTVNEKLMVNQKGIVVKDVLRGRQVFVNIVNLPNKESLAVLAVYIPSLDELYKELEIREQKLKNVEQQRDEYNKLADDQKQELDGYRARTKTQPMIGFGKPIFPIPPKSLYGLAIGAVVAGFASSKISGMDVFARYVGLEYLFLAGAVVIVIAVIKIFDKKSEHDQKFQTQKAGDVM